MGIFSTAIIVTTIGVGTILWCKDSIEEMKRKNTPCNFDNGISQSDFNDIVKIACQSIERVIDYSVNNTKIRGKVRSNSGITDWHFTIDFNDYGNITGRYWLESKNNDSKIPEVIAERIKSDILKINNKENLESNKS